MRHRLLLAALVTGVGGLAGCDLLLDALPDDEPPRIRVVEPADPNGVLTKDATLRIVGRAVDNRGVERVVLEVDGEDSELAIRPGREVEFTGITTIGPATESIRVMALDAEGNRGEARLTTPRYDATPPVVTITHPTSPSLWTAGPVRFAGEVRDEHGVQQVVLRWDGAGAPVLARIPAIFDTVVTTDITIEVAVVAMDSVGNEGRSPWFTLRFDGDPPVVRWWDTPLSVREDSARLRLEIHDAASGLAAVHVVGGDTLPVEADARWLWPTLAASAGRGGIALVSRDGVGRVDTAVVSWTDLALTTLTSTGAHTCARTDAGTAYCSGPDDRGQLGDGAGDATASGLVEAAGDHSFARLVAGRASTCGIDDAGVALCWGANDVGQLGDGTRTDRAAPTAVVGQYQMIAVGDRRTCALDLVGAPYCWGLIPRLTTLGAVMDTVLEPRPISSPVPLTTVVMDDDAEHTCGLDAAGAAYCWGRRIGFVDDADSTAYDTAAVRVADGPFRTIQPLGDHEFVQGGWTFALSEAGEPVRVGGGRNEVQWRVDDLGPGPYDGVIPADGLACAIAADGSPTCMDTALPPALSQQRAAVLGLVPASYSGGPCYLTEAGSLYCWSF